MPSMPNPETPVAEPCLMLIFGASGDLTKRLLTPALYNLACDGLLPEQFAIIGMAMDQVDDAGFRDRIDADIRKFSTRHQFDPVRWDWLKSRLHYMPGNFGKVEDFKALLVYLREF